MWLCVSQGSVTRFYLFTCHSPGSGGSGGSTPVQDEDGYEGGSGQATPVRDESPGPDSPAAVRMATEDDDYVSDGGEVEREVEHQEVEDDGDAEDMEREEVSD